MYASIDIGTNTALLLVAEIKNGKLQVIREEQRVPRLGQGVDAHKNVSESAMQRVIVALKEYRQILENEYQEVSQVYLTGTSAFRDAANRGAFMQKIKDETGLEMCLLSGMDEARLTYKGALGVLNELFNEQQNYVIDIGGGSSEVACGEGQRLSDSHSFDMGSVRYTERFLKHDPPISSEMEAARNEIERTLNEKQFKPYPGSKLIGVAGTVTSLAFIEKGMTTYVSEPLNGYLLSLKIIQQYIKNFSEQNTEEIRAQYPEVMKGRADIILAGLLILEAFMMHYNFEKLTVSTGGIRHGIILDKVSRE